MCLSPIPTYAGECHRLRYIRKVLFVSMSSTKSYRVGNELKVHVGSLVCSDSDVIFPIETIQSLTEMEIGQLAKSLIQPAIALHLQELAESISRNGIRGMPDEILQSSWESLSSYQGDDPVILDLLSQTKNELDRRLKRSANRSGVKKKRKELQNIYEKLLVAIGRRDGFSCANCGSIADLTLDHIVPLILGGSNDQDNLQILCRSCNSRKGAR